MKPRGGKAPSTTFLIRLTEPEKSRYEAAAQREQLSLSEWIRQAAELAIARGSTR